MKNKRLSGAWGMLSEGLDNPEPPKQDPEQPAKRESKPPQVKEAATNKPVSKKPAARKQPAHKADTQLVEIDPARVRSWNFKDRQEADLVGLEYDDLLQSIARKGQDTPIAVRKIKHKDYDYEEITGFRRLNACRALGKKVLAIVREFDDRAAFASMISENDDRSGPSYWRRGESLKLAIDKKIFPSIEAMSIDIGINRSTISNYVRVINKMPKPFIERCDLHLMGREVLFYLMSLEISEDQMYEWLNAPHAHWRLGISTTKKEVEKSFKQFMKQIPDEKETPVKKDGAKTYVGKAGKLFSVTRKGESVFINILKDGKRIMTEEEIAEALQKIMDEKAKS